MLICFIITIWPADCKSQDWYNIPMSRIISEKKEFWVLETYLWFISLNKRGTCPNSERAGSMPDFDVLWQITTFASSSTLFYLLFYYPILYFINPRYLYEHTSLQEVLCCCAPFYSSPLLNDGTGTTNVWLTLNTNETHTKKGALV